MLNDGFPAAPQESPTAFPAMERHKLFEKLARIQRSISHGSDLQDVLDAITQGAGELIGDEVVGLRLVDEEDPDYCRLVSSVGVEEEILQEIRRSPVGVGAGGRAIRENRLIVIQDYSNATDVVPPLSDRGLQVAMAAPVHEKGKAVGSLVVASYSPERTYTDTEQEALLAFAEHASLAIMDARAVDAMRQAQRAKEMFLAVASHGLKTPLTVITGTLLTLIKHHSNITDEMRGKMLNSAYERAVELETSISQMLEGARAELAGSKEEIRLQDLVARALDGFEGSNPLIVDGIPDQLLLIDADAVHQILGVLLENAVSHSVEGAEISVGAEVRKHDVTIGVSNPGSLPRGFDAETLFQPFRRGPDARSSGVGLGLYIAREIARSIGGAIDIASDTGTVSFKLRLPLESR